VPARIKWEGCGRKSIWHKNGGDDGGWSLISTDGVAPSFIVGVSASDIFYCTIVKKISSGTGLPHSPGKRAINPLCVVAAAAVVLE